MKRVMTLLLAVALLGSAPATNAGKPSSPPGSGGKPPGSGGNTVPNPDIVYMALGGRSANPTTEIRGETPNADGSSFADSSLVKATSNRDHTSIAWSPDGSRFAWLQNGTIMAASPGKTPSLLYDPNAGTNRPKADMGGDGLAWGPGCEGGTALAFKSLKPYGVFFIQIDGAGVVHEPQPLVVTQNYGSLQGMAFSPHGRYLAVAGWSDGSMSSGINLVPMCGEDHTPFLLVGESDLVGDWGSMDVPSMDWSRHGERLAVSMVTSDDPNYPWRDLKIIDLSYDSSSEAVAFLNIWTVDLDYVFGAASSEHSPQWGPSKQGDACQRIAFSQSAGVSDGSDSNGRNLYLLDINAGQLGGCAIDDPSLVTSKSPRALDWK